jgi:hypothetical protein
MGTNERVSFAGQVVESSAFPIGAVALMVRVAG